MTRSTPGPITSLGKEEEGLFFDPPLYSQRAQLVHNTLQRYGCRRIVDAGCSYGDLLLFLMNASSLSHVQPTQVTAIDLDGDALREVAMKLPFSSFSCAAYTADCTVQCLHGDLTSAATIPAEWLPYPTAAAASCADAEAHHLSVHSDAGPADPTVDAVFSIEVIEHIPPHLVAAYTHTLFYELGAARGARVLLLTTPNRDENYRLPSPPPRSSQKTDAVVPQTCAAQTNSIYRPWEAAPRRRHDEHFFELTRAQWRRYVQYVEACYGGYWRAQETVLLGDGFTQGTLFVAREGKSEVASRAVALANFPFEGIFGMTLCDYVAHFSIAPASDLEGEGSVEADALPGLRSCGCDVPYTRLEHRVVGGVPLWERFCAVVRRGMANARIIPEQHAKSAMPFDAFFTAHLVPSLHEMMEMCTLPLLLSCLREQCALWNRAVHQDAGRWRRWCLRERSQPHSTPMLVLRQLCARDAHTQPSRHAEPVSLSYLATRAASRYLRASRQTTSADTPSSCPTPLFPFPSVATTTLARLLRDATPSCCCGGDARGSAACTGGLRVLEKGIADSVGLLLVVWLTAQVEGITKRANIPPAPSTPTRAALQPLSCSACTMKTLPTHLLQLLFYLVSVDVLRDVYGALGSGWGNRERHLPPLFREVSATLESLSLSSSLSSSASAAATATAASSRTYVSHCRAGVRHGRRRQQGQGPREPAGVAYPHWLATLLKSRVSVS